MNDIRCPLNESATISFKEPALISGEVVLLYSQLDVIVTNTARRLTERGVGEGARIGIFMHNGWKYVVLILALFRCKAMVCPLSTRLPARALRARLDQIGCSRLLARVAGEGVRELDGLDLWNPDEVVPDGIPGEGGGREFRISLNQPATIVYTSGSTGEPKAVEHTYGNYYYSARGSNILFHLRSHDRWLVSLPFCHVGGLGILFRCLLTGATAVLPEQGEELVPAIERYGATHVSVVATQLRHLLKVKEGDGALKSLKVVLAGGGPVPAALIDQARAGGLPVCQTYGLTEMTSQVATLEPEASIEKQHSCGKALPYAEARISDEGEIMVRGNTLFSGYIEGEELHRPEDADGWFGTGDLGDMDKDGYLTVHGRKDNLFVSGGENIQPEEIEILLLNHHDVDQALVVPVEDEEFGYRPLAFVKSSNGKLDPRVLVRELEHYLPRFKIPVDFRDWPDGVEEDPLKVDRAYFRQLAALDATPSD